LKSSLSGFFIAAICLKKPFPALFSSLPAFNRRTAGVTAEAVTTLFDFAPDEACRPALSPMPRRALTPPFHPYLTLGQAVYFLLRCLL